MNEANNTASIVGKVWSFCNTLRDDGVGYGDYLEQLTFLLFLKMADEFSRPPHNRRLPIPPKYAWGSLTSRRGADLEAHYTELLRELSRERGVLGQIFFKSQNKIQDPAKLYKLIDLIDREQWSTLGADVKGRRVDRIGVLGTGFMGAGIAAISVQQGVSVRFKDTEFDRVAKGVAAVRDVLKDRLTKRQITRQQFEDQLSLVAGTVDYTGFGRLPLVIEAVFEDLKVKHAVLSQAEAVLPEDAIFATNTSTIPIAQIAAGSRRPDRVIGMHFFSPVHRMPLLEVIVTPQTAAEVTATVVDFGRRIGKTVIVVNDAPGFFVNRILAPYINEAGLLLDQGIAVDAIDKAMARFGFPVGPINLIDEVGLDIAGKSGAIMADAFGSRMTPSTALQKVLGAGRLGRKGKKGFYSYDDKGKRGDVDESVYALYPSGTKRNTMPPEQIQQRLSLAMVNEAARCLEEGIIHAPRDGDIGAVFGIGFPPFRGGPFRHMDSVGVAEIVKQLEALDAKHPGRFTPARILKEMAASDKTFYPTTGKPV